LDALWDFEAQYKVEIDSGCVEGWYGKTNAKFSQSFNIRAEKDYSRLTVSISGFTGPALPNCSTKVTRLYAKQDWKRVWLIFCLLNLAIIILGL
jgi:hypothetical protein